MAQTVKHLPTTWEILVWALGQEDSLEKKMAIHSSTLAWKIQWTVEPGRLQPMGSKRVRHDWTTLLSLSILLLSRSPVSNLIRNSALFSGFPEWLHHFEFAQHERSSFSPLLPECDVATMSYFSHYDRCVVVRSLSHVRLFATPWTAACQASRSFTISGSSSRF